MTAALLIAAPVNTVVKRVVVDMTVFAVMVMMHSLFTAT